MILSFPFNIIRYKINHAILKNEKILVKYFQTEKKRFGELHQPRTRHEKKYHLDILDEVYFDMTEAIEEKNKLEREEYNNIDKNISDIILNYNISKKNEIIKSLMRYSIEIKKKNKNKNNNNNNNNKTLNMINQDNNINNNQGYQNQTICFNNNNKDNKEDNIFPLIKSNIKDYSHHFNTCEIGIILKCFLKINIHDIEIINTLLHQYFKRNMKFSIYGSLYVLNFFSKCASLLLPYNMNNLKLLCSDILKKIHLFEFKNICIICNYASSLYLPTNKMFIHNFIEKICTYLLNEKKEHFSSSADSIHYICNACARVHFFNKEIFNFLKIEIEKNISSFSLDQLVSLCNAYSKFKNAEQSNYLSLFLLLADHIINKSYQITSRHLSVLANSFNNACILHEKLFYIITQESLNQINSFQPQQLVMIIHAYVNIGLINNKLLYHIWEKAYQYINEYTLQELSMLIQAYTKSSQHIDSFFNKLCHTIYISIISKYPFLEEKKINNNYEENTKGDMQNDNVKKDNVKKDNVKKDNVKKDNVKKDNVKNENVKKDKVKNDNVKKDNVKKDNVKNENVKKDKVKNDNVKNDYVKNDYIDNKYMDNHFNDNIYNAHHYQYNKYMKYLHILKQYIQYDLSYNTLDDKSSKQAELIFYVIYNNKNHNDFVHKSKNNFIEKKIKDHTHLNHDEKNEGTTGNTKNDNTNDSLECSSQYEHNDIINKNTNILIHNNNNNNNNIPISNNSCDKNYFIPNQNSCHEINKLETWLKKYFSQHINPTLLCSIIYSLIKGNCLLQYDLLIVLTKLSLIFLEEFKYSELANICLALSEAYIRASEENNKQNDLISIYQKEDYTHIYNEKLYNGHQIFPNKNIPTYDKKLYYSSKEYLFISNLFFDQVQIYLNKQTQLFTDIHTIYKFITSFGSLKMNKYANISLHLFHLSIFEIKKLSYLPLQKMANSFMQMNVYNEDVYAYINKLQKMKKIKK
ncbi:conserved Plasmodium protein, unknown function [Plasmodium reichenowi]|uniref:RNA-editing substrate-binding complex 6 protein domain-containing protein n=1 Tax=Plasmodium reichenowi TaxID=5854 RepID=A0A060RUN9_PLARE|nr:conserved Plasmodium protein, unknown function [Plasmodium reichenowi]